MGTNAATESTRKSSVIVVGINTLARALGLFSSVLTAKFFGASLETDILYLCISLSVFFGGVFTVGMSSVFLPMFIRVRDQDGEARAWQLASSVGAIIGMLTLASTALFWAYPEQVVRTMSHFDAQHLSRQKHLLLYFPSYFALGIAAEYLRTILNAYRRFTLSTITNVIGPVVTIGAIVFFSGSMGVESLALALVLSSVLQVGALYFNTLSVGRFCLPGFADERLKEVILLALPPLATQIVGGGSFYFYDFSASQFENGMLTALSYATRLFSLPEGVLYIPLAAVFATRFSEYFAGRDLPGLSGFYLRSMRMMWFILLPLTGALFLFPGELIKVLFERGQFGPEATLIAARALRVLSICLFALGSIAINTRLVLALQKTGWTSVASLASGLGAVAVTYLFTRWFGYIGVPLARVASVLGFSLLPSFAFVYLYLPGAGIGSLWAPLAQMTAAMLAAFAAAKFLLLPAVLQLLRFAPGTLASGAALLLALSFGSIAYLEICRRLKLGAAQEVAKLIGDSWLRIPLAAKVFNGVPRT